MGRTHQRELLELIKGASAGAPEDGTTIVFDADTNSIEIKQVGDALGTVAVDAQTPSDGYTKKSVKAHYDGLASKYVITTETNSGGPFYADASLTDLPPNSSAGYPEIPTIVALAGVGFLVFREDSTFYHITTDFSTYTNHNLPDTKTPFTSYCYAVSDGTTVYVQMQTGDVFTTTDGVTWTKHLAYLDLTTHWAIPSSVAVVNGKLVSSHPFDSAGAVWGTSYTADFLTTSVLDDGETAGKSVTARYIMPVAGASGEYYTKYSTTTFLHGTDPSNMTEYTAPANITTQPYAFAFLAKVGSTYVFVTATAGTTYWTSTDLTTWTPRTSPFAGTSALTLDVANGKVFAFYQNGAANASIAYSDNGIDWTVPTIATASRSWKRVLYVNGRYHIIAPSSINSSADLSSWSEDIANYGNKSTFYGSTAGIDTLGNVIALTNGTAIAVYNGTSWSTTSYSGVAMTGVFGLNLSFIYLTQHRVRVKV